MRILPRAAFTGPHGHPVVCALRLADPPPVGSLRASNIHAMSSAATPLVRHNSGAASPPMSLASNDLVTLDAARVWDRIHQEYWGNEFSAHVSAFARFAESRLSPGLTVLELGCGAGADAEHFSSRGLQIHAVDFSEFVIEENRKNRPDSSVVYGVHDISERLPYEDQTFDAVYSRLSIHYFDDLTTRKIISDVHRVLKPGSALFLMCKSTSDPLYGIGRKIAEDTFADMTHVRHFFSRPYMDSVLTEAGEFAVEFLHLSEQDIYGSRCGVVEAVARRLGD